MNVTESRELANRIEREDPRCRVTGTRHWCIGPLARDDFWDVDVVDTRTGIPFIVSSPADWDERVKSANWPSV